MASYKVIQDIEAEDKLLGPLTLRQFIYAAITAVLGFIIFKLVFSGAWFVAVAFLPPAIFFAFLAAPFGHDQSSEVWMLAKVRFALKPRIRIWDQSGTSELVTITAPKIVERNLSDGLSQTEVRNRLQALASTIDSRGWAVADASYSRQPTDRLVAPSMIPQEVPAVDTAAIQDVMDETTSVTAQHFDRMIAESEQNRRQQIDSAMQQAANEQPQASISGTTGTNSAPASTEQQWFMNNSTGATVSGTSPFDNPAIVIPGMQTGSDSSSAPTTAEEVAVLEKIHKEQSEPKPVLYHMRVIEPIKGQKSDGTYEEENQLPKITVPNTLPVPPSVPTIATKAPAVSTPLPTPVIMNLASDNNKFVSTIAREAEQYRVQTLDNEVIVTLLHPEAT